MLHAVHYELSVSKSLLASAATMDWISHSRPFVSFAGKSNL
jgi:hypothetical protein